jgi:hypothetical protein
MTEPRLRNLQHGALALAAIFFVAALFLLAGGDSGRPQADSGGRPLVLLATALLTLLSLAVAGACALSARIQRRRRHRERERQRLLEAERRADIAIRRARIRAEIDEMH